MINKFENFLHYFLIFFMAILTSMIFVGVPVLLCFLAISELSKKGLNVIFIAGLFSAIVIIYFVVVEFIMKSHGNKRPIIEQILHLCAEIGSILLIIAIGLFIILFLVGPS